MSERNWPEFPPEGTKADLAKVRYEAEVALEKAAREEDSKTKQRDWDAESEIYKGFHTALRATAQSFAGQNLTLADMVQKSAAAIGTLYTGLLGLVFSVSKEPLPLRGIAPALFIGLAVTLSTAYVAFLTRLPDTKIDAASAPRQSAMAGTNAFIDWVRTRLFARVALLRGAVLCLGFGLALLPAAFIDISGPATASPFSVPDWPSAPTSADPVELREVLFKAQVAETAELRQKARAASQPAARVQFVGRDFDAAEFGTWAASGVFALVVLLVMGVSRPK